MEKFSIHLAKNYRDLTCEATPRLLFVGADKRIERSTRSTGKFEMLTSTTNLCLNKCWLQ